MVDTSRVQRRQPARRKSTGAHYTPPPLAAFVAERMFAALALTAAPRPLRVVDPACGDGELLLAFLRGARAHAVGPVEVFGFDTDPAAVKRSRGCLASAFPAVPTSIEPVDFVALTEPADAGPPLARQERRRFDLVIANPPYVRTQVLGAGRALALARQFGLSGRVDLYYAFLLAMSSVLVPGGVAGVIVSNRFMTTRSGAAVRAAILETFDILEIWDLGDTKLFEAAVLPAVLVLRKKDGQPPRRQSPRFASIYSTAAAADAPPVPDTIAALTRSGVVEVEGGQRYLVKHGTLAHGDPAQDVWRIATEAADRWLATVAGHTYCEFGAIGNVRVGVKTTADKVFIRSDWREMPDAERPELLRPLVTHHVAGRFRARDVKQPRQILYTHQVVGGKRQAVRLEDYPRSARYLSLHTATLVARTYVREAGRNWYEIWVPQDPAAWDRPKLVFRDISEAPTFWMDLGGAVVNGDCYWLACDDPRREEWLWLALAVGNSTFIEAFYDHRFNNRLYAGRRRFMTQYVEKFPLPRPDTPTARRIVRAAKERFALESSPEAAALERELDRLVWQAFGLLRPGDEPEDAAGLATP